MLTFRPATPADAPFAAPLIAEAYGPLALELTAQADEAGAVRVLEDWFTQADHRLGYGVTLLALDDSGAPLGILVRYSGDDAARLETPMRQYLRGLGQADDFPTEAQRGELYLDALAVAPAARGRGVGLALLHEAQREAAHLGLRGAALLVEPHNPAQRLYERAGFARRGELLLPGHTEAHLDLFWTV